MNDERQWYQTGFDRARQLERERELRRGGVGLDRFFVRVGEERIFMFLDGEPFEPFSFWEHHPEVNGEWRNTFETCTRGVPGGCLFCEKKFGRQAVGAFTGIDLTPWRNRDDKLVVSPRKKLMVCVSDAQLLIESKKEKYGGSLTLCIFSISRTSKRNPRVGNDFDFVKRITDPTAEFDFSFGKETFRVHLVDRDGKPMDLKPFGLSPEEKWKWYCEVFKPKTREEIQQLFEKNRVVDSFARMRGLQEAAASGGGPEEEVAY